MIFQIFLCKKCVFAIFDFSKTVTQIMLELGGNVPFRRAKQRYSQGGDAIVKIFLKILFF